MSRDARPDDVSCPFCGHELTWDEWQRHWHNPNRIDDSSLLSPIQRALWEMRRIWAGLLRLLSAVTRLLWNVSVRLLVVVAAVVVLLTIVLSYYHWNKGTSVESALELTAQDYQLAAACPSRVGRILGFVQRPALKVEVVGVLGDDWKARICDGADLTELLLEADGGQASPTPTAPPASGVAASPTAPTPGAIATQPRSGLTSTPPSAPTPQPGNLDAGAALTLKSQLPKKLYEEFESSFYGGCPTAIRERLSVTGSWSGRGDEEIRFLPPDGTYYLVVAGEPEMTTWHFASVIDSSNGKFESLAINSGAPEHLSDAQQWCTSGLGMSPRHTLEIDSLGMSWTVYLIEPVNEAPLTTKLKGALDGYFDLCPEMPPIDSFTAQVLGTGDADATLDFTATPPYYILGVLFEPAVQGWSFDSVDVRGDRRSLGPAVSHESGDTLGLSATCPTSASSHHLEIESTGGRWTAYLIEVPTASSPMTEEDAASTSFSTTTAREATVPKDPIMLSTQLPRGVYEEFESSLYGGCPRPAREKLTVVGVWFGQSDDEIEFFSPRGGYFLVVEGNPETPRWDFNSVLVSRGSRSESLHISSDVPEQLIDATQRCTSGFGTSPEMTLEIDSSGLAWTVSLIAPIDKVPLRENLVEAVAGFYGLCPEHPPIDSLSAQVLGNGEGDSTFDFTGTPPFYFLGVKFEPAIQGWSFSSVDVSGDWRSTGPKVSHESGDTISFSAICPISASSHHLDIESHGGRWTVYLITTSR